MKKALCISAAMGMMLTTSAVSAADKTEAPAIKRDVSQPGTVRIEIDARQLRGSLIQNAKASEGLVIRPCPDMGEEGKFYFEVVGTKPLSNEWQEFQFSFSVSYGNTCHLLLRAACRESGRLRDRQERALASDFDECRRQCQKFRHQLLLLCGDHGGTGGVCPGKSGADAFLRETDDSVCNPVLPSDRPPV